MQKTNGIDPITFTPSPGSSTGPGAETNTGNVTPAESRKVRASATVVIHVTDDSIALAGTLDLGGLLIRSMRGWSRIPDGWMLASGPVLFSDHEDLLGHALVDYLTKLPLPVALADSLQEPRGGYDEEAADV